jgi:putative glutamine amidotransferase
MPAQPLIALIATRQLHLKRAPTYEIPQAYLDAILTAGGLPILLPTSLPITILPELVNRFDGFVLSGGGDVDPALYGGHLDATVHSIDPERDAFECALIPLVLQADKPLLAICRGAQILNVALGGSLYEDIPSALPAALRHDWYPNIPRDYLAHTVEIEPGSRLAEILGTRKLRTNSLHHQAIRQPAPGLEVVARAEDGVIEAVELPGKRFAIGVQWHPECLPEESAMQRLFSEFVNAARE